MKSMKFAFRTETEVEKKKSKFFFGKFCQIGVLNEKWRNFLNKNFLLLFEKGQNY